MCSKLAISNWNCNLGQYIENWVVQIWSIRVDGERVVDVDVDVLKWVAAVIMSQECRWKRWIRENFQSEDRVMTDSQVHFEIDSQNTYLVGLNFLRIHLEKEELNSRFKLHGERHTPPPNQIFHWELYFFIVVNWTYRWALNFFATEDARIRFR